MPHQSSTTRRGALIVFAAFMVVTTTAVAQSQAAVPTVQDLIGPIQARVSNPNQPFDIFIDITIKPGMEDEFECVFAPAVAATRPEPGNLAFQLTRDPKQPNVYLHHERWRTLADLERHMGTPHMQAFWPVYLPMLARTPEFKITMTRDLADTATVAAE